MRTVSPAQEFTETQAAEFLGISLEALHRLLDQHIFNNGSSRPDHLVFSHSDLLLLSVWTDGPGDQKILPMPRRL